MLIKIKNEELYFLVRGRVKRKILEGLQIGLESHFTMIQEYGDDIDAIDECSLAYEKLKNLTTEFNNINCEKEALSFDKKYLNTEYKSVLKTFKLHNRCINDLLFFSKLFESNHDDSQCFVPITATLTQQGVELHYNLSVDGYSFDDFDSESKAPKREPSDYSSDVKGGGRIVQRGAKGIRPHYD